MAATECHLKESQNCGKIWKFIKFVQEFEKAEEEETHRPIEGQLLKWTNVVKGEISII